MGSIFALRAKCGDTPEITWEFKSIHKKHESEPAAKDADGKKITLMISVASSSIAGSGMIPDGLVDFALSSKNRLDVRIREMRVFPATSADT